MNVAFYAPLKTPDSPVPSGDRLIARMLITALRGGGHDVVIASRLRAFDRIGNQERQQRIARIGAWSRQRIVRRWQSGPWQPDLWLTYHLYHKAPDWIGPGVAEVLGIPYCVAEASSSPRAVDGPWAGGHAAVATALADAALVINFNPKDEAGIRPLIGRATRCVALAPFIDGRPFRAASNRRLEAKMQLARTLSLDPRVPWLLAVGMLRAGDKARSYQVLAHALSMIADRPWQLIVIGDGEESVRIKQMFLPAAGRVFFAGQQATTEIAAAMAACDVFVWPAINEAIGMVFVEAAMAGLPVVGADRPGIAAIVEHGETGLLVPEGDAPAFAAATAHLLENGAMRQSMAAVAALRAASRHDLATTGARLCRELEATLK